jgi:hypothetical protein
MMTPSVTITTMNDCVREFFNSIDPEMSIGDALELWNAEEQQQKIKTLAKKPSTKKTAVKKDKNAPKKGATAWMLFCKEQRPNLPDSLGFADKTRQLAEWWACLKAGASDCEESAARVAKFTAEAAEDKERYIAEMESYVPTDTSSEDEKETRGRKKGSRKIAGVTGARSSYILFGSHIRPTIKKDNPDIDSKEVVPEIARLWAIVKEDKKEFAKWQALAAEDKDRFEAEKAAKGTSSDEEDEKPVAKKPVTKKPVAKKPVAKETSSDEEPVAAKKPVVAKKPVAKKPAKETSSDEEPVAAKAETKAEFQSAFMKWATKSVRAEHKAEFPDMLPGKRTTELKELFSAQRS